MRGKHQKPETLLCPSFFSVTIYHFSQSPALFLPRFLLYYVNVCGGWACLRVCLREGFEGRMDRQQDGSGGASKCRHRYTAALEQGALPCSLLVPREKLGTPLVVGEGTGCQCQSQFVLVSDGSAKIQQGCKGSRDKNALMQ